MLCTCRDSLRDERPRRRALVRARMRGHNRRSLPGSADSEKTSTAKGRALVDRSRGVPIVPVQHARQRCDHRECRRLPFDRAMAAPVPRRKRPYRGLPIRSARRQASQHHHVLHRDSLHLFAFGNRSWNGADLGPYRVLPGVGLFRRVLHHRVFDPGAAHAHTRTLGGRRAHREQSVRLSSFECVPRARSHGEYRAHHGRCARAFRPHRRVLHAEQERHACHGGVNRAHRRRGSGLRITDGFHEGSRSRPRRGTRFRNAVRTRPR